MNPHSLRCVESARSVMLQGYGASRPWCLQQAASVFVYDEGNVLFVLAPTADWGGGGARLVPLAQ